MIDLDLTTGHRFPEQTVGEWGAAICQGTREIHVPIQAEYLLGRRSDKPTRGESAPDDSRQAHA